MKFLKSICCGVMLAAAFLAWAPTAQAQITNTTYGLFDSGSPTNVSGSATLSAPSSAVLVRKDRGLAIMPYFATTNSATANVVFNFNVSYDLTNYSTTLPISITNVLNGTTGVRGYSYIPPAVLNGIKAIRLQSIINAHTGTVWVTNITWSYNP